MGWLFIYMLVGILFGEIAIQAFKERDGEHSITGNRYITAVFLWPLVILALVFKKD